MSDEQTRNTRYISWGEITYYSAATLVAISVLIASIMENRVLIGLLVTCLLYGLIILEVLLALISKDRRPSKFEINEFPLSLPSIDAIQVTLGVAMLVAGVAVFGFQIYWYLKNGSWMPLSLIDVASKLDVAWAQSPNDWVGIWEILNYVPTAAFLFATGVYIYTKADEILV